MAAHPCRNSLNEYFKDSRNVRKLKDPSKPPPLAVPPTLPTRGVCVCGGGLSALLLAPPAMRFKLLKHTRLNVVAFLNELPKTQHDVNSFVVDVCAQTVSGGESAAPPTPPSWALPHSLPSLAEHAAVLRRPRDLQGR